MEQQIKELKSAFAKAKNEKDRAIIDKKMRELIAQDGDAFTAAMIHSLTETADKAEQLAIKVKPKEITPAVSLAYISKTYFNKTRAWLYQRINGNEVNGKIVEFSNDELKTLKYAFNDLSKQLRAASVVL